MVGAIKPAVKRRRTLAAITADRLQLKEKLNKIITPLVVILCGLYFAFTYTENIYRDYYFLFHKTKTTANVISITNDRIKLCVLKLSYDNANTHQIETCDFVSDFYFGNKAQTNSITKTDIYYTTLAPYDIYIIDYKSPTIAIIIIRLLLAFLIYGTILYYFIQLIKNIRNLIKENPVNADT